MVLSIPAGFLPLLNVLLATTVSASIIGDVPLKYQHVCDPKRFTDLRLDISKFQYCDKALPYNARARDLVKRMTLAEKVQQLGDNATGVASIGLPAYEWWSEALHGIASTGPGVVFDTVVPGATSFPNVILSAATFNRTLWNTIGKVVSTEGRAMYNMGKAGLTFWSPTINVARDPRWGRIMETPGEDPFVVGSWAVSYVRGLQDIEGTERTADLSSRPLKVSACCKHYTAYDVDNWKGVDRFHFDAQVAPQDMTETFQVPFEMCVKRGDVSSVMCSYNRVNGIPTCADPQLLKEIIRGQWKLNGYIVADCDSIEVMTNKHKYLNDTPEDAVAQTLKAGLDMDCGTFYPMALEGSVRQGKAQEPDIDNALINNYIVLMRLGFFDGIPKLASLGKKDICAVDHMALAEEAARKGIVLLKNDMMTLPLNSGKHKRLAVVGPHGNATSAMIGNYAGIPCRYITPVLALSSYGQVTYESGCLDVICNNTALFPKAVEAAKTADATILFFGLDQTVEAESLDRVDLLLPGSQTQLVTQVAEAAPGPVILVILSAGGVDINFAKNNSKIKGILWAGYPGQEGGRAIADIIFGKYNPGGKLPITWYENSYVNQLPMTSMKMRPDPKLQYPGRTYKFFDGPTVYPFGYGLSYTRFAYELAPSKDNKEMAIAIELNNPGVCTNNCPSVTVADLKCNQKLKLSVMVKNMGSREGDEAVIVYSKPPTGVKDVYFKRVIGFDRVFVPAGGSKEMTFAVDACESFSTVEASGRTTLFSGDHTIVFGDNLAQSSVKLDFRV